MENIQIIFLAALRHFASKAKSQTVFADTVGITVGYLNHLLKGRNKGSEEVKRKIAQSLGYKGANYELFLDVGRAILAGKDPDSIDEPQDEVTGEEIQNRGFITIPFSDNMKLAAGSGGTIPITENDDESTVIIHGPSIGRRNARNLQAFRVGGDSMEPIIAAGGIVIADLSDNDPTKIKDGKIYVLCWDLDFGECAVKYLRLAESSSRVVISSPDPVSHPPIVKRLSEIQLIGRVIWSWREH
jgi:transcriptional regulator with XRE-family HTH domain